MWGTARNARRVSTGTSGRITGGFAAAGAERCVDSVGLVPNLDEAKAAAERAEAKLDRIIELMEMLLVAQLHEQGIPLEEIKDLLAPKQ